MPKRPRLAGKPRLPIGEDGATVIEYGLLIAFVALACVAAVAALGGALQAPFQHAVTGLS